MENGTIIPDGQPGAQTVAGGASDPAGTGPSVDADTVALKKLNTLLGKNFPDIETLAKSYKDTASYVGKKIEAIQPQTTTDPTIVAQLRELKTDLFYSKNPQYDTPEYRAVISKMGENPSDVVQGSEFKTIFEKTTGYDKIQKTKTVLESNPRIGQVRNKITEARQAVAGRDFTTGAKRAVEAVLEAHEE